MPTNSPKGEKVAGAGAPGATTVKGKSTTEDSVMSKIKQIWSLATAAYDKLKKLDQAALTRIAKRIGFKGQATAQALYDYVKNNKVMSAVMAYELYDITKDIDVLGYVEELRGEEPPEKHGYLDPAYQPDTVGVKGDVAAVLQYRDEFEALSHAEALFGGRERLIALRNAIKVPDEVFEKRDALATLKKVL